MALAGSLVHRFSAKTVPLLCRLSRNQQLKADVFLRRDMLGPKTGTASRSCLDSEGAAALALQGLAFLAGDEHRLSRFLSLTGMGENDIRAAAVTAELQAAVLEHLLLDESLLLVFAAETGVDPASITPAHAVLTGGGG
jgi:Protein of unknown function (DUF3572)